MTLFDRFKGSIICGAIGDAYGSAYENNPIEESEANTYYPFGKPTQVSPEWNITDDTQMTLATIESLVENGHLSAESLALKYLQYYQTNKIRGIGSSTLKALQELEAGGHWSQVGRKGEYAAGNGAAMRITPLAFAEDMTREKVREICYITHRNEEAYVGALCVYISIQSAISGLWTGGEKLLEILIDSIPDTRVRDRLIEFSGFNGNLAEYGKWGNNGYVVNSIPLSIVAASKVHHLGLEEMFKQLIQIGGDTDTNCSIAGQIAGALLGPTKIPDVLLNQLAALSEYIWILNTIDSSKPYFAKGSKA